MKKRVLAFVTLFLGLTLFAAQAQTTSITPPAARSSTPGEDIAQTISMITGVAISPLLGVSAVGAWQYFKAKTPEQRARLQWYSNPWFWVPALLLVTACFIKDTAGTALPTVLKKPLDVADTIEHKISGLVATGAFVPLAVSVFHAHGGDGASLSGLGFAAADLSWLYNVIMVPASMVVFFIVFLASNAVNILILLSPFTTVDATLKGFRTAILASVAGSAWLNPWIGAAWALVVIGLSWFIAGWSFRLSCFGMVFIWDFLTGRCHRFAPDKTTNKIFLSRKIDQVPARTYGKLTRNPAGRLTVSYRPWLVLPRRTLTLPEGRYEAGRGLFYSEILRVEGDTARTMILLPPRYLGHEEELVVIHGLAGARAVGFRAAWQWFTELFGGKPRTRTSDTMME
jgi:hypothetical protein